VLAVIKLFGGDVLSYLESRSDSDVEKQRIAALYGSQVIQTAMAHRVFWVAWGMAALPMAAWFGYAMVNTIIPSLPHVAAIPAGLKYYADNVWANIFFTGGIVASLNVLANTAGNIFARIFK
jgi:hypothetical protein